MATNPPESGDSGASAEAPVAPEASPTRESLLQIAQVALGLLGVLIVLAYPLGFVTSWIQIAYAYDYTYETALRAVTLICPLLAFLQAVLTRSFGPPKGLAAEPPEKQHRALRHRQRSEESH